MSQQKVLSKINSLLQYNKSTNADRVLMDGLIDLARLVDGLFDKEKEMNDQFSIKTLEWDGVEMLELHFVGTKPTTIREALSLSIKKWELIREMTISGLSIFDGGTSTCGLCMLFWDSNCRGCPIFAKTGQQACGGTPYSRITLSAGKVTYAAIDEEIEFLKGLLEELEAE